MTKQTQKQEPQNDKAETAKVLTVAEMEAQAQALQTQIAEAKAKVKTEALDKIKATAEAAGLTIMDIIPAFPRVAKMGAGAGLKLAPKYRNNATGETWTGRGVMPKWLSAAVAAGAKREDFVITAP